MKTSGKGRSSFVLRAGGRASWHSSASATSWCCGRRRRRHRRRRSRRRESTPTRRPLPISTSALRPTSRCTTKSMGCSPNRHETAGRKRSWSINGPSRNSCSRSASTPKPATSSPSRCATSSGACSPACFAGRTAGRSNTRFSMSTRERGAARQPGVSRQHAVLERAAADSPGTPQATRRTRVPVRGIEADPPRPHGRLVIDVMEKAFP